MSQYSLSSDVDLDAAAAAERYGPITLRRFFVVGAILCTIYIAFMYYTPMSLLPIAGADDGHFIMQGIELTRGHWIGGYSSMTLVKGPGLPIFLALSNLLGLPYSVSIAFIEAGAFFFLSAVVGRFAKAPGLALLTLGVLLTFPWMWSGSSLRILRDGFYTALIFIALALAFLTIWGNDKHRKYCALGTGFVLGLVSITREENPWLFPAIALLLVILFFAEQKRGRKLAAVAMLMLWAAVGLAATRGTILAIHYVKYKTLDVADMGEKNFRNALRALYSVETPTPRLPHLLLSHEARAIVYEHSPTFARLKPMLDGDNAPLSGWQGPGCQWYGGANCHDYWGGWFVWALRDAVSMAGGYANSRIAAAFYRNIADEIGRACEGKEIKCRYSPIAEIPPLVPGNFSLMLDAAINTVKLITFWTPLDGGRPRSMGGSPEQLRTSASFLHLSFMAPDQNDPPNAIISGSTDQMWMIVFTQSVQNRVRDVYNAVWPAICALGILAILLSTGFRLLTTGIDRLMLMTWTLLTLIAARIGLLTIIDATVHPAATIDYTNPAAYCLAAAVAMGLYSAAQDVASVQRRRQSASKRRQLAGKQRPRCLILRVTGMTPSQEGSAPPVAPKGRLSLVIRSVLSVALIGGLVYYIGSAETLDQIRLIPWHVLLIVVLVLASHVLAVTPRWAIILSALGYPQHWLKLVGSVFLGFLFNQLLPTAVGGDVIRAMQARQLGVPLGVAIHSVVLDRAAGVLVLLVITISLLPFTQPVMFRGVLSWFIVIVAVGCAAGGILLWAIGRLPVLTIPVIGWLQRIVIAFRESAAALIQQPYALAAILVATAIGHIIPVAAIALLASGLNVAIAPVDVAVVTLGALLIATVPLSIAGWGIREGALVFLFGAYGVPAQKAFAISILFGVALMIASLPGALVLFIDHAAPASKRPQALD